MENKEEQYSITITFLQAKGLAKRDKVGHADPYGRFYLIDENGKELKDPKDKKGKKRLEGRTKKIRNSKSPVWNEKVTIGGIKCKPPKIVVECMDFDRLKKDDLIGKKELSTEGRWDECGMFSWYALTHKGKNQGKIQIQVQCRTEKEEEKLEEFDYTHLLQVKILKGQDIKGSDLVGGSELYTKVNYGGLENATGVVRAKGDPEWNQSMFLFADNIRHKEYKIKFTIFDKDNNKDDRIGEGYISVRDIFDSLDGCYDKWITLSHNIVDSDKRLADLEQQEESPECSVGKLHVECTITARETLEPAVFKALLSEFDTNKDDAISREEIQALFDAMTGGKEQEDFDAWFQTIDENKDGKISQEEVAKYMSSTKFQTSNYLKSRYIQQISEKQHGHDSTALMKGVVYKSSMEDATIAVKERQTGLIVKENIPTYVVSALKIMFGNFLSRHIASRTRSINIMQKLSERQGKKFDDPSSKSQIQDFVDLHNLDTTELEKPIEEYKTFNDFFARGLKPDARPTAEPDNPSVVVSPADCRMMVFPDILDATDVWIKGSNFTLENLFGDKHFKSEGNKDKARAMSKLARNYLGGSLLIARLSPQDYHRWHIPVTGTHGKITKIPGALYTVNPLAINKDVDVYTENKRAIIEIQTKDFGKVILVAVAATMVGSYTVYGDKGDNEIEGSQWMKGTPHGEFRFGGSTVLVLFEPGVIEFDEDLLRNSKHPIETLVRVNTRVGVKREGGCY